MNLFDHGDTDMVRSRAAQAQEAEIKMANHNRGKRLAGKVSL
ncbi:MAG: hypothetical protein ACLQBA_17320 [Candidatus Binataceae bacterium]